MTLITKIWDLFEENLIWPIERLWSDFQVWIRYHVFGEKHDVLNLKIGRGWIDKDYVLMEAMFHLLVEFVEVECAGMERISTTDRPWWRKIFRCLNVTYYRRNAELGIKYLNRYQEWLDDGSYKSEDPEMTEHNKKFYKDWADWSDEIITLYKWWKEERPNRIDLCDLDLSPDDYWRIKTDREKQDLENMKKLVDLSPGMWT